MKNIIKFLSSILIILSILLLVVTTMYVFIKYPNDIINGFIFLWKQYLAIVLSMIIGIYFLRKINNIS